MNLTSLHFKRNNSGVFHSFKFTPGKDKLRNLYIFSGKDLHPQWLLEAIKFLFNTEKHPSFEKVYLELADDAGDIIVIEKDRGVREFYKNGKPISREEFIEAIYGDQIELETFIPEKDLIAFKINKLDEQSKIVAREENTSLACQKLLRSIARETTDIKKSLMKKIEIPSALQEKIDWKKINTVVDNLAKRQLLAEEIKLHEKKLKQLNFKKNTLEESEQQNNLIMQLECTIDIVRDLSLDKNQLESEHKNLTDRISKLKKYLKLSPKEIINNKQLYNTGLHIIARMELLGKVTSILDEKRHHIIEHIKSPFLDTTSLIKKLLSVDDKSFSELSQKLTFMETSLLAENLSLQKANTKSQNWFELFKKESDKPNREQKDKILDVGIVSELKAISVDIDSSLSNLRLNFASSTDVFNEIDDSFEVLFEAYLQRLSEIKQQWQEVASKLKANEHSTFIGFCDFYIKSMQLVSYSIQKNAIEKSLGRYSKTLISLKKLITEWFKQKNSQKASLLDDNLQSLITEAEIILKARETVTKNYKSNLEAGSKFNILSQKLAALNELNAEQKEIWDTAFKCAENKPSRLDDELMDFIRTQVYLLKHFQNQKLKVAAEGVIPPFSDSGAIFSTWMIDPQIEDEKDCQSLANFLVESNGNPGESKLIATENLENANFWEQLVAAAFLKFQV